MALAAVPGELVGCLGRALEQVRADVALTERPRPRLTLVVAGRVANRMREHECPFIFRSGEEEDLVGVVRRTGAVGEQLVDESPDPLVGLGHPKRDSARLRGR